MDDNPYAAPAADDSRQAPSTDRDGGPVLASRWARLGGAVIDTIILLGAMVPLFMIFGFWAFTKEHQDPGSLEGSLGDIGIGIQILSIVLPFVLFVVINGYLIYKRQQTVGKLALGMRVVADDGRPITGNRYLFVRYLPIYILSMLPFVGWIIGLIDVLLIFRSSKKCLHDDFARTIVVRTR